MKKFSTPGVFCPHFPICGGCEFDPKLIPSSWDQFISHPLFVKSGIVPNLIRGESEHCRYKARLAIRQQMGKLTIGLFQKNSHKVEDIFSCRLHHEAILKAVEWIREWMESEHIEPYDENLHRGFLRYLQLVVERKTGRVQLVLVCNCDKKDLRVKTFQAAVSRLFHMHKELHSIWLNFQPIKTNTILGKEWLFCEGEEWLWQPFLGRKIAFHPGAFVQAHLPLFEKMVEEIAIEAQDAKSILELYAGVGAIGFCLASGDKRVKFVENNPYSYLSFCETKKKYPHEIEYFLENVEEYVTSHVLDEEIIIVDPPRRGLGEKVLSVMHSINEKKLIYVSCNEKSFIKDVLSLEQSGWRIRKCAGYLFFPGTERFEILAILEKGL